MKFVDLQEDGWDAVYAVVDLHAITMPVEKGALVSQTRQIAAAFLACGVDPKKSIIYAQSSVKAHVELAWIFNCVARLGWLNRMTQFKEKAGKNKENASVGLYAYPNLMAADILLYKGTHVPVGGDQKQHLELVRDIANKFNNDFGVDFFPIVEPLIFGAAARVMSLRDGTAKMSKSDPSDMSRIAMTDDADAIAKKIRKAKTDPDSLPSSPKEFDGRPEAANLMGIYAALADMEIEDVCEKFGGQQFSDFKQDLTDLAVEKLAPMQGEMRRLMDNPGHVDGVIADGAGRARAIAEPILAEVHDILGFLRPGRG